MKKYKVTLVETLKYEIEVMASNMKEAEEAAFASDDFANNHFIDNDARVTHIQKAVCGENE